MQKMLINKDCVEYTYKDNVVEARLKEEYKLYSDIFSLLDDLIFDIEIKKQVCRNRPHHFYVGRATCRDEDTYDRKTGERIAYYKLCFRELFKLRSMFYLVAKDYMDLFGIKLKDQATMKDNSIPWYIHKTIFFVYEQLERYYGRS